MAMWLHGYRATYVMWLHGYGSTRLFGYLVRQQDNYIVCDNADVQIYLQTQKNAAVKPSLSLPAFRIDLHVCA